MGERGREGGREAKRGRPGGHSGRLACGAVVMHEGQRLLSSGGVHSASTIVTTATGGRAGGREGERGREGGREATPDGWPVAQL